jgi:hypothetical protein
MSFDHHLNKLLLFTPIKDYFLVGEGELKSNVQQQVASMGIEQQVVFLG